jgi:hypothetical protein
MLTVDNLESLPDILDFADGHEKLTDWESEFISDMKERYDKYGFAMMISERQIAVLNKIATKLGVGE